MTQNNPLLAFATAPGAEPCLPRFDAIEPGHVKPAVEQLLADGPDDPHHNAGFLRHTMMDALVTEKRFQRVLGAYRPSAEYPANPFAASLRNVAALIASGASTRVYFVSLGGFSPALPTEAGRTYTVRYENLLAQPVSVSVRARPSSTSR